MTRDGARLASAAVSRGRLRHRHLGARRPARSVFGELQAAYEAAIGR